MTVITSTTPAGVTGDQSGEITTGTPASPAQPETQPGPVPYDRFREVNERARTLEAQIAKIEADRKAATEKAAAEQGQWQQLAEQRANELAAERLNNLRLKVASQKGIPPDLVDRLRGEDQTAMEKDADALLAFLKPATGPGVPPPSRNGQPARLDIESMTPEEIRKNAGRLWVQKN
jgi:hypothetical protein